MLTFIIGHFRKYISITLDTDLDSGACCFGEAYFPTSEILMSLRRQHWHVYSHPVKAVVWAGSL